MIKTSCAKFRRQKHPNNTLLPTWAAFLSQKHLILHDLHVIISSKMKIKIKIEDHLSSKISFDYINNYTGLPWHSYSELATQ